MPSWTDQVQALASIAGVVIAVVGFFFVSYQVWQISQTNRASAHTAIFTHSLELTRLMFDNPEVRPYLCGGKELRDDDPLRPQVDLACEMFGDFYEHVSLQRENLPVQSRACWDKAIAYRYQKNPTLRNYLDNHRPLYAADLFASVARGGNLLAERAAEQAPKAGTATADQPDGARSETLQSMLALMEQVQMAQLDLRKRMLLAGHGALFHVDMLASAALNRSLAHGAGIKALIESRNLSCSGALLRLQLDTLLRFYAGRLVDSPEQFAKDVLG